MKRWGVAVAAWFFAGWLVAAELPPAASAELDLLPVVRVELAPSGLMGEKELAELLELEVPGPWDGAAVALTRENLEHTGRFSSVQILRRPVAGGVALVVELTPQAWARRIIFTGRRQLSVDQLLAAIKVRHYGAIEAGAVASAAEDIAATYEREGYPRPVVESKARAIADDGATEVLFAITETPLPALAGLDLSVSGNAPWYQDVLVRGSTAWTGLGMRLRGANQVGLARLADRLQRRLRHLGYAEATVEATSTTGAEGERLELNVDFGRRTRVKGKGLGRGVLKEVTETWRARPRPLNDRAVDRLVRSATANLHERGYLDAEVAPRTVATDDEMRVVLAAERGTRSWVDGIELAGNTAVANDELLAALDIAPPRWLGMLRSRPGPQSLTENERALEALYAAKGYPSAVVTASVQPASGGPRTVRFTVAEGLQLRVGSVELRGVDQLPAEKVHQALGVRVGDPWSQVAVDEGVAAVAEAYRREGFSRVSVQSETAAVDGEERTAVVVDVVEGARTVLGPTIVRGAFKTRPEVIQRLHRQRRGDPFELKELAQLQRRLNRLGAFEGVTIGAVEREHAPPGETAAQVTVREAVTGYYEVGFDYNSDRGFELVGSIGNRNLMRRGVAASVGALLGNERGALTLNLTQPLTFGFPLTSFVRAGFLDDRTNPGFAERRMGGEVGVEHEYSKELNISLAYRLERHAPYDVEPDVDETLLPETRRIGALNPVLIWEGRDDPFNASRGGFAAVRLKSSRPAFGAAVAFDRLELDGRFYSSLSDSVVVAAALRLGVAEPRGGDTLPLTERFFIGGASSHRGFREKELGPKGDDGSPLGGESFILGNVELRFPLWGPVDAGVFTDVGNVFFSGRPERDLLWALGGGLRLRTPVGPVRVDVGYLLDAEAGEDRTVVHIALGHAF